MYDDYDLEGRPVGRWIALTIVVGTVAALGFTMLRDQQNRSTRAEALSIDTVATIAIDETAATTTTVGLADDDLDENDVATGRTSTDAAPTTTVAAPTTTTDAPAPTTTEPTAAPSTTAAPPTDLGYPAAPDGTPLPVIVTYDTGTVKLTGFVPSEDSQARLVGLAVANSQEADPDVIDNLIINEAVPASVGVRVIEMNSARFGEGEAQLTPDHTAQFDRVAAVLNALPHVSVLVIGHADQRGDDQRNLELSENRASTVVDYLTYLGVDPTRLSMRGAGETDLLTLEDDGSALALNRRTEFIFSGVLL